MNSKEWNNSLKRNPFAEILQTTYWANYLKGYFKEDPIFLKVIENGEIHGQLLCSRQNPYSRLFLDESYSPVLFLLNRIIPVFTWYNGPVIFGKKKKVLLALNRELKKYYKLRINSAYPPVLDNLHQEMVSMGFKAKPVLTFIVDLRQPKKVLWKKLKKTARKCVNRTISQNVEIREVKTERDLVAYHKILDESRIRSGIRYYSLKRIKNFFKYLQPYAHAFLAVKDELPLGALSITTFNKTVREFMAGSSNFAHSNGIYVNDLLKWHVIEWGQENGKFYYDLAGVQHSNPGIYRFKAKWGGDLIKYYTYSKNYRFWPKFQLFINKLKFLAKNHENHS